MRRIMRTKRMVKRRLVKGRRQVKGRRLRTPWTARTNQRTLRTCSSQVIVTKYRQKCPKNFKWREKIPRIPIKKIIKLVLNLSKRLTLFWRGWNQFLLAILQLIENWRHLLNPRLCTEVMLCSFDIEVALQWVFMFYRWEWSRHPVWRRWGRLWFVQPIGGVPSWAGGGTRMWQILEGLQNCSG